MPCVLFRIGCFAGAFKTRFKRVLNTKGLTLMEMVFSLFIIAIITTSAISVFVPTLQAQRQTVDISEVNSQLDIVASLILDDIVSALEIEIGIGTDLNVTIFTTYYIEYTMGIVGNRNIILRNGAPLIDSGYYRNMHVFAAMEEDDGVITLTLTMTNNDGFRATREYISRPVGLS